MEKTPPTQPISKQPFHLQNHEKLSTHLPTLGIQVASQKVMCSTLRHVGAKTSGPVVPPTHPTFSASLPSRKVTAYRFAATEAPCSGNTTIFAGPGRVGGWVVKPEVFLTQRPLLGLRASPTQS